MTPTQRHAARAGFGWMRSEIAAHARRLEAAMRAVELGPEEPGRVSKEEREHASEGTSILSTDGPEPGKGLLLATCGDAPGGDRQRNAKPWRAG